MTIQASPTAPIPTSSVPAQASTKTTSEMTIALVVAKQEPMNMERP
jgi:hypothetical protein